MADEDKKPVVAYLGPEGSYTHQAALSAFPQQGTPAVTLTPLVTIEDVFSAVQSGTAHRGVVPFENSSNGSVVFTLDLFADTQSRHPDILVCGEAYVAVRHCLLGFNKSKTASNANNDKPHLTPAPEETEQQPGQENPTLDLSHIQHVYSHPQAWGQCNAFLHTHLKTAERHDVSSTSKAAEIAAADASGASAALSSIIAAQLFSLDVLAEGVNDRLGNTTRFLVLRRRASALRAHSEENSRTSTTKEKASSTALAPHFPTQDNTENTEQTSSSWKSLVSFTLAHTTNPGALANCLAAFAKQGVTLTSINTRPSGVRNWDYIFFVEFKGRSTAVDDGGEEGAVDRALEELARVSRACRWLGSWENRLA